MKDDVREYLASIGRRGGAACTAAQNAARARNAQKAGRPAKRIWVITCNGACGAFMDGEKRLSQNRDDLCIAMEFKSLEAAENYSKKHNGVHWSYNYPAEKFIYVPEKKRPEMIEKLKFQDDFEPESVIKNLNETGYIEAQYYGEFSQRET